MRKAKAGARSRKPPRNATYCLIHMLAHLQLSLLQPRPTCLGIAPPTVGWAVPHLCHRGRLPGLMWVLCEHEGISQGAPCNEGASNKSSSEIELFQIAVTRSCSTPRLSLNASEKEVHKRGPRWKGGIWETIAQTVIKYAGHNWLVAASLKKEWHVLIKGKIETMELNK